jgi:hypothetical protein
MINSSLTNPIWLISDDKIGSSFDMAMADARNRFLKHHGGAKSSRPNATLTSLNDLGIRPFAKLPKIQIEQLLLCCIKGNDKSHIVKDIFPSFPSDRVVQLCSILKVAFVRLWIEKQIILPLGWNCPINCDRILDELILEQSDLSGCELLMHIRAVNPTSSIPYSGAMSVKQRSLRATFWLRLLLASNLFSAQNLTLETARDLKRRSFGCKSELARYYPDDFSLFVAEKSGNMSMRDGVNQILVENRTQWKVAHESNSETFKEKKKNKYRKKMFSNAMEYLEGRHHGVGNLASIFNDARDLNKAFKIEVDSDLPGGLEMLPEKVTRFCKMISSTYNAFLRSKRLENTKNHHTTLYCTIAYCGPYLFKYFMNRDGNLDQYPETFNDFSCALYVTADQDLLKELGVFEKEPPETLISFIEHLVEINDWTPETHYARIYPLEEFFDYVAANSALIPSSENVRNSFSSFCYPKTRKRFGTVKKPIPRAYFSTFVNMLDSLEYLVMHLNEMADGTMSGIVAGRLKTPNISELIHGSDWTGLWGIGGLSCEAVDLAALNYCPVFYYEGKPRPFTYIPRFYRISDTQIDGKLEPRIIMNDVRITQLMCETGIRQQHLLWLDKDRYDCYVNREVRRPLSPLLVSSDKAHGEWTSIVSTKVIDLLDRQHAWYDRCTDPAYKKNIWYNLNPKSQFGSYKPLFRLPLHLNGWKIYDSFKMLLLCLQYFIKSELEDEKTPDIVWQEPPAPEKDDTPPCYITDHSIAALSTIAASNLTSDYTPHGLRAGFVSEAIKFLPPSIVGQWLTGQTEPLVHYYAVFDEDDMGMTHQQLLCRALMRNQDRLSAGDFPDLAEVIEKVNRTLREDIAQNPVVAISKHRLMSLSHAKRDMDTGLDRIIAKEVSELAFNLTHICPFNNICPKEVIDLFGEPNGCSACPFAIRGVAHLPAISARKDKYKELMVSSLKVIEHYLTRKPHARVKSELETLEHENDRFAREACLLEAIEAQLLQMHAMGMEEELMVKNRTDIVEHYQKLALPDEERLLKRLIDVQNFPDSNSEDLSMRLSYLRHALLMREGNLSAFVGIGENHAIPLASKVAMQISSMVKSGAIDVFEVYAASTGEHEAVKRLASPVHSPLQLTQMVA